MALVGALASVNALRPSFALYRQCAQSLLLLVRDMSTRQTLPLTADQVVLDKVYAIIKYMPHIDAILLSTSFLVYHADLIENLALVKVLVFFLMLADFDASKLVPVQNTTMTTVVQTDSEENMTNETILYAIECLTKFSVKLHAAYARIRIELKAHGVTTEEQFVKLVDWTRESHTELAQKCFRIRGSFTRVLDELQTLALDMNDVTTFKGSELLTVTKFDNVNAILDSNLIRTNQLIFQDKASFIIPRYLRHISCNGTILDANANRGIRTFVLSDYLPQTRIIALDARWAKSGIPSQLTNTDIVIIPLGFLEFIPGHYGLADTIITTIIVEPGNTLSAIYDSRSHMLQEQEIPTERQIETLVRSQQEHLCRALAYPDVERVIYQVRSHHNEETIDVVYAALERFKQFDLADLQVIKHSELEGIDELEKLNLSAGSAVWYKESESIEQSYDSLLSDGREKSSTWPCLLLKGNTAACTNGVFIAVFERLTEGCTQLASITNVDGESDGEEHTTETLEEDEDVADQEQQNDLEQPSPRKFKIARNALKRARVSKPRKATMAALSALSLPRLSTMPPPTSEQQREWNTLAIAGANLDTLQRFCASSDNIECQTQDDNSLSNSRADDKSHKPNKRIGYKGVPLRNITPWK